MNALLRDLSVNIFLDEVVLELSRYANTALSLSSGNLCRMINLNVYQAN